MKSTNVLTNFRPNLPPRTFYWQIRAPFPTGFKSLPLHEKNISSETEALTQFTSKEGFVELYPSYTIKNYKY